LRLRCEWATLLHARAYVMMKHALWVVGLLVFCLAPRFARCQEKTESTASVIPQKVLQDELLDKMVGKWRLSGKFEGQPMNHSVEVRWVLNHQFIDIHERDLNQPKGSEVRYEAMVYVGYEATRRRYVAHWLDVFGDGSPTLGYGKRAGSAIQFDFGYPGQPWLTTFRWNATANTWQWVMQTKTKEGQWQETANMTLTRASQ
jgi:hypothetical protein